MFILVIFLFSVVYSRAFSPSFLPYLGFVLFLPSPLCSHFHPIFSSFFHTLLSLSTGSHFILFNLSSPLWIPSFFFSLSSFNSLSSICAFSVAPPSFLLLLLLLFVFSSFYCQLLVDHFISFASCVSFPSSPCPCPVTPLISFHPYLFPSVYTSFTECPPRHVCVCVSLSYAPCTVPSCLPSIPTCPFLPSHPSFPQPLCLPLPSALYPCTYLTPGFARGPVQLTLLQIAPCLSHVNCVYTCIVFTHQIQCLYPPALSSPVPFSLRNN